MKHFDKDFNDNCYELNILRWFRDNFVTSEDIDHYYEIAPSIVCNINEDENADLIYEYIYDNVIDYCIKKIENGRYDDAYIRYKDSVLLFETQFSKTNKLIKKLK